MRYLLDTDICIPLINGTDVTLQKMVSSFSPATLVLCSVVKAELDFGAKKSTRVAANLDRIRDFYVPFQSIAFDDVAAARYGTIRSFLELNGTLIGQNDMLIASIALANELTLISRNIREFQRVPGLAVHVW